MVVAYKTYWFGITDLIDDIDTTACIGDAKATACEDLFIALGVEFGESLAELELFSIDLQGAEGAFFTLYSVFGQGIGVDAKEIAHTCLF